MVHAFGLDERTVAEWRDRAGKHCQQVHTAVVHQGPWDLVPVQADEIRVKGRKMSAWMGQAMMVSTRFWLGGVVQISRDRKLADRLLSHVRACRQPMGALLVCTDGWNASPNRIRRACREKVKEQAGPGRAVLRVWPQLCLAVVIKRTEKKRVGEVTRKMVQGRLEHAQKLLAPSQGGTVRHTALIERLHGTVRERLARLTRKCRHAAHRLDAWETGMELSGCTSNVCWPHHELSRRGAEAAGKRGAVPITPAIANGLTDPVWSICERLRSRSTPSPWVDPTRRRRSKKQAETEAQGKPSRLRSLLHLRKGVFCSSTREGECWRMQNQAHFE